MTYYLNPQLVEEKYPRDLAYAYPEQFVFLRDPKVLDGGLSELSVGDVVLHNVEEDSELAAELQREESALPSELQDASAPDLRIFRTSDCFGYSKADSVVLLVRSTQPIFVDEDKKK
jgi:hypothetical protein